MKNICLFSEQEWPYVRDCLELMGQFKPEEAKSAQANLRMLLQLGKAFTLAPAVLGEQKLGQASRSTATLAHALCRRAGNNDILNIPTRAVLGNSLQVAKINFLFLSTYLRRTGPEGWRAEEAFRGLILANVFNLMCEELFLALFQDPQVGPTVRHRAAAHLCELWEHRLTYSAKEFAPVIYSLWNARGEIPPAHGTLMGVSELLRLAQRIHPVWVDFLYNGLKDRGVFEALEEFIFGLSHEEILRVRKQMEQRGLHGIGRRSLHRLGMKRRIHADFRLLDPREFYRFFLHRRGNAAMRRRLGLPGPQKTVEEFLLGYLLAQPDGSTGLLGVQSIEDRESETPPVAVGALTTDVGR